MKTIRLNAFGDDVLHSEDDARTFRARWGKDDVLDFTGIREVSLAFLNALFEGCDPASLLDRITHCEALDATLSLWLDQQPTSVRKEPARPAPVAVPALPQRAQARFEDAPGANERYTPTRLAWRLRTQLTRYLEGAYPLNHPLLIKARRRVLTEELDGRLLAQDPFVETTPRYIPSSKSYLELGISSDIAGFYDELSREVANPEVDDERTLLFPSMYEHQRSAYEHFLARRAEDRRNLLVATGTGSGKTECFLVPLLGALHQEAQHAPARFEKRAVRALILYPMNALVNDQLARLRLLFGSTELASRFRKLSPHGRHPTFGMYTGRTPYPGPRSASKDGERVGSLVRKYLSFPDELALRLKRLGRYPAKDLKAFLAEDKAHLSTTKTIKTGANKGKFQTEHHWDERLLTGSDDRELLTRHEMLCDPIDHTGHAPDILVTNYSMLEYMLMRPIERPIFDETRAWLEAPDSQFILVLDEAHMYRGARGAEVAFLIRRLLARLGITDRPEKFRAILTSASLGGSDGRKAAMAFAADLTGLPPDSFEVVTGTREIPKPAAPGDTALAQVLAAVDLDALHAGADFRSLRATLSPLFVHLLGTDVTVADGDEPGLLRALYDTLKGRPFVHAVIEHSAGNAVSLSELAATIFPDAADARRATEVLLTLGALARPAPEEPGLLPTRVHLMFRGLPGLFACINRRCSGRQEGPGEDAPVGRLYVAPRTHCESCGGRVFELASCRECGAAYLVTYVPRDELGEPKFLWGEPTDQLTSLRLLPEAPRNVASDERVLELVVQLRTGAIVPPSATGEVRRVWASVDQEKHCVAADFKQCPICQPPSTNAQRRTAITTFQTRGEQPFTSLIEAQFAEQPPQKNDITLPNRGRKVLVFSDGRQKAARLAPALETNHASDVFRQVLAMAARMLAERGDPGHVHKLYALVVAICAKRGIELFPNVAEADPSAPPDAVQLSLTKFRQHIDMVHSLSIEQVLEFQAAGVFTPPLSYVRLLFRELTDRFFSLPAIGLAVLEDNPKLGFSNDFPAVGLSQQEAQALLRQWLRVQMERRCFLVENFAIKSFTDDVQDYRRPMGIRPNHPNDLVTERFHAYLIELLGDGESAARVEAWFTTRVRPPLMLPFVNDHYLSPLSLTLKLKTERDTTWWRCRQCNRLHAIALKGMCFDCLGTLDLATTDPLYLDARSGYYRDQVLRALAGDSIEPFGLVTAEHSAQLSGVEDSEAFTKTERYELRFQDIPADGRGPVDVLSCTTTMEVGIDIGTLSGVALRNVPPHVANYQQRAGRAGRRGRSIASVITYAQGGSHDAHHFEHPEGIISGAVRTPVVYVENQTVLTRHVQAFLIQVFFHQTVAVDPKRFRLMESLGTVESFLDPTGKCTLVALEAWLRKNEPQLKEALSKWVPTFGHALGEGIDVRGTIDGAVERLIRQLRAVLPIEKLAARETLPTLEKEGFDRLMESELLQTLIDRAIVPRYAFPTDTVSFWVVRREEVKQRTWRMEFDYQPQRDLQIALSEYAPTRELTIDKIRFQSAALFNPYGPGVSEILAAEVPYVSCGQCGFVSLQAEDDAERPCRVCGSDEIARKRFVRPAGFASDVNAPRRPDEGGSITYAGQAAPAKIELIDREKWDRTLHDGRLRVATDLQDLVVVNKGIDDTGFLICPDCGRAEPPFGPRFTTAQLRHKDSPKAHPHPIKEKEICHGSARGAFFLGYTFRTDVLLIRLSLASPVELDLEDRRGGALASRKALTSLVEAISLAATRLLQIDEGELAGNWNPVAGNLSHEADLYLYDVLPGGAGYTRDVERNLERVLLEAERLLSECAGGCESSCYSCLRHYGNQMLHPLLDRGLALALLRHILRAEVPSVSPELRDELLRPMADLLALRSVEHKLMVAESAPTGPITIPMVVKVGGQPRWVDVTYPLIDPDAADLELQTVADARGMPFVPLNAHTLRYDLPSAYRKILGD